MFPVAQLEKKKMSKQPGIFSDIGKMATDLLYGDYIGQRPMCSFLKLSDWSFDTTLGVRVEEPGGPRVTTLLKFDVPYLRSREVETQYLHDYIGVTSGFSLTKRPVFSLSGVTGSKFMCIGTDVSVDSATETLAKYNAGLSINTDTLTASLTLDYTADTLRALCYRPIQPLTRTAIAAELKHRFISKQTMLTVGAQHSPTPFMLIKARMTSDGSTGAVFENELLPGFFLTIATEMNVMQAETTAKMGFSFAFKG